MIERRLEDLVLEHEALALTDALVDLLQGVGEPVLATAHVILTRVVRAVGEPDLEVARPRLAHDVDALEVVVDRLLADLGVGVGDAAELVVVVLERVRVDCAEGDAVVGGVLAQVGVRVDLVPRDVQRDRRGESGELMYLGGIRDLLERVARNAGLREDLEARSRVAERPRGQFDGLLGEARRDAGEVRH